MRNDLQAENINIVTDDAATFFWNPDLPISSVGQAIFINKNYKKRTIDPSFLISMM
jgi:hypothetical protein